LKWKKETEGGGGFHWKCRTGGYWGPTKQENQSRGERGSIQGRNTWPWRSGRNKGKDTGEPQNGGKHNGDRPVLALREMRGGVPEEKGGGGETSKILGGLGKLRIRV